MRSTILIKPNVNNMKSEIMERFEYRTILETKIPNKIVDYLNKLGSVGWELVEVEKLYFFFIVVDARYYFKRKLRE